MMRWFVRGDLDGFFGLALDNLVQLLLIHSLCANVLGFSEELIVGRILPGAAVSLLVGNLFYSWQAMQLASRTGRDDVCALPYGINTVSLFGHVFLVMLPAKLAALQAGSTPEQAAEIAWRMGLAAALGSGLIEFFGAFVAEPIRRMTPRAALLSTLAGIALGFISLGFLFRSFARPEVGLTTLGVILLVYFGRVRFRGGIPGGLVAVALGTALAWTTGVMAQELAKLPPSLPPQFRPPVWSFGSLAAAFTDSSWLSYLSVIVPMGLFNLIGSLQNLESAEAAGDPYPTVPSLAVNGLGTIAAAVFGSCFPTTIYIGHPGWKAMGARAGYSILNGVFFTAVCGAGVLGLFARVIPVDAGMAIVLWIGMVITAQAFQVTPREHAPAVVVGLLAGVGAWGAFLIKEAWRTAGVEFGPKWVEAGAARDFFLGGAFVLEQGFIFTAMILAAATVALIENRYREAAAWCLAAAVLSATGLMHGYAWTPADTVGAWQPAAGAAIGYAAMAALFAIAPWVTEPTGYAKI